MNQKLRRVLVGLLVGAAILAAGACLAGVLWSAFETIGPAPRTHDYGLQLIRAIPHMTVIGAVLGLVGGYIYHRCVPA